MKLELPARDGWLFAVFNSPDVVNKLRSARPYSDASKELEPGVQLCLTLFAYNVYSGSETTRNVCLTGAEPSEGPVQNEPPAIGTCEAPPEADGKLAEEFVSLWCRERAQVCEVEADKEIDELPAPDCSIFHETCDAIDYELPSDSDGHGEGATDSEDEGEDTLERADGPQVKDGISGCSVGAPFVQRGPDWWWFARVAGLALWIRRRRRCRENV